MKTNAYETETGSGMVSVRTGRCPLILAGLDSRSCGIARLRRVLGFVNRFQTFRNSFPKSRSSTLDNRTIDHIDIADACGEWQMNRRTNRGRNRLLKWYSPGMSKNADA